MKLDSSSATRLGCRAIYLAAHTLRLVFSLYEFFHTSLIDMGCGISPGFHLVAEQTPDDVVVDGQAVLREHRVAELLELFQDFVVHAGIVVIRAAQQHHAQPVFALQLFQHLARRAAHGHVVEVIERAVALFHGLACSPRATGPGCP